MTANVKKEKDREGLQFRCDSECPLRVGDGCEFFKNNNNFDELYKITKIRSTAKRLMAGKKLLGPMVREGIERGISKDCQLLRLSKGN